MVLGASTFGFVVGWLVALLACGLPGHAGDRPGWILIKFFALALATAAGCFTVAHVCGGRLMAFYTAVGFPCGMASWLTIRMALATADMRRIPQGGAQWELTRYRNGAR